MNIGYQYLLQNKNVLMVSLEMSEQMYSRRMSALFSDINVNQLKDHTEILKKRVTTTKLNIPSARLYIKQYSPNEFNSIKLKSLLHKLKESKNFIPDLIIVDYLNIMSTNGPSYGMKSYERVGTISKELRSVSIETKIKILSATQANRRKFWICW
jgi:replicative DNA helicase